MWTEKQLQQLKSKGMIRGYHTGKSKEKSANPVKIEKRSKEKGWLNWNLAVWCEEEKLTLKYEYRFDQERKWRFDWAIPEKKIAIEYEGLNSEKSRHTTKKGFTGDTDKYNRAQVLGWKVIRITALNYKTLFKTLKTIYE